MDRHLSAPAPRPADEIELFAFFDLRWVENTGVSLGLLTADSELGRWLLVARTAAIADLRRASGCGARSAATTRSRSRLILGGALGNIVDRVRYGYVVDFADLHFGEWRPFLVFNVGDAAITIGVLLLLVRALLMRDGKATEEGSLTMRIAISSPGRLGRSPARRLRRRRPVRPRAAPTSSRSRATRRWWCRPISR